MNALNTVGKIKIEHTKRNAYLYIRQSTIRQVLENTESTKRQYALKQKAVSMGWPLENIVIIDTDLGKSGAESDREGFRHLVSEVGLGKAGMVMGLEVSRLARNSMDWHKLLEICSFNNTLILDEEGVYDPASFNDRLLLGLKGTMSEAELHIIKARLQGGIYNKAQRGELKIRLPVGLIYDTNDRVILDPDLQIQTAVKTLFNVFLQTGAACATVKYFRKNHLKFPRKPNTIYGGGETLWVDLDHKRVLDIIHNPRYTGAFVFGRRKQRKNFEGKTVCKKVIDDEWAVVIQNAHVGYISWETYLLNKKILTDNAQSHGLERKKSPPKEGAALLQGIVVCGVCGCRMTIRYKHSRDSEPYYVCQRDGIKKGDKICQSIPGKTIDEIIGFELISMINLGNINVSLAVAEELNSRKEEAHKLKEQEIERARYETELARRRYLRVDPDNRLVADTLEADWNEKLRLYQACLEEHEQHKKSNSDQLTEKIKFEIRMLAENFPKIWNHPQVSAREKKRLLRLLIEDVTLIKKESINVHIRFKGGTAKTMDLSRPKMAWELRQTKPEVINIIDQLLDQYTDAQIAQKLNEQGFSSGMAQSFHAKTVGRLRHDYNLKSLYKRLKEKGLLTEEEIAKLLNVVPKSIKRWRQLGIIKGIPYDDRPDFLYEHPGDNPPVRGKWKNRTKTVVNLKSVSNRTMEVQCAT